MGEQLDLPRHPVEPRSAAPEDQRGRYVYGVFFVCTPDTPQCIDAIHEQGCACGVWLDHQHAYAKAVVFTGSPEQLDKCVRARLFERWWNDGRPKGHFDLWFAALSFTAAVAIVQAANPPGGSEHYHPTVVEPDAEEPS